MHISIQNYQTLRGLSKQEKLSKIFNYVPNFIIEPFKILFHNKCSVNINSFSTKNHILSMPKFIFVHTQAFLEDSLLSADVIKFEIKFNKIIPHCLLSIIFLITFPCCLPECPETKCNLNYNPGVKKIIF